VSPTPCPIHLAARDGTERRWQLRRDDLGLLADERVYRFVQEWLDR
jgi:hypothetical protein